MSYTISPEEVITYSPQEMQNFKSYGYEYIDNRLFTISAEKLLGSRKAYPYIEEAKKLFIEMGWEGDGEIELLWLPPFVFPFKMQISPTGIVIWHVKQSNNGESFLLSPILLPFEEFFGKH